MTEEHQVEPTQETPETTQETTPQDESQAEKTVDEKIAEAIAEVAQGFKKEVAGLNRRNSELEKELAEERKAKMSEEERIKAEIEEAKKEAEAERSEAAKLRKERLIDKALYDVGLPVEFAKHITGDDEESINDSVTSFNSYVDTIVNKKIEEEINKRLAGKPPEGGGKVDVSDLQSQYDNAKKSGDTALAIAIKRRAAAQGEPIK